MTKIKILHVLPSLEIGGMENALITLINAMDRSIFNNYIFCFDSDSSRNQLQSRLADSSLPIYNFEKGEGVDYWLPIKIARLLRKEKIDIVHTRNFAALLYGATAASLARTQAVIGDIRGYIPPDQGQKCRQLSFLVSKFVAVSQDIRRLLAGEYRIDGTGVQTIYNGVDFNYIPVPPRKKIARRALGFALEDLIIGTVGRFEPVKDYETLLRASAPILYKNRLAKLLMVGDGSQRETLQRLAIELGISAQTVFTGYQNGVSNYLEAMDLFVLTSLSEGISNVLLEAMATSLPVVATAVGGNPEVVVQEETGYLVPVGDVRTISEKIEGLLSNPMLARQMGQVGRQLVEQKFTIEKMVTEYQRLYIDILK
ncbi:glycosyltransferase [candidate division KSB1 bacterium]|nr:glycosyltransferase [candidate division KSB1 bacterium]